MSEMKSVKKELKSLLNELSALEKERESEGWEEKYIKKMVQINAFLWNHINILDKLEAEADAKVSPRGKQERAMKDLSHKKDGKDGEWENAISRLNAIPSELEVMLYLHSKGKILFSLIPGYTEKLNIKDSIDICFMDQEEPEEGYTNMAGVDVKNPDVKNPERDYDNFLIETKKKYGGTWYEKYAWAQHFVTGTSRYLAYVRGGQKYGDNGGKLATETPAYSEDKTERENKEAIVEYFWNNRQWLNHPIEIIKGEDVRAYLHEHGDGKQLKSYMMGHKVPISEWTESYPALRVEKIGDSWQEMQLGQKESLILCTEKREMTADLQDLQESIEKIRKMQAGGLTLQIIKLLFCIKLSWDELPKKQ